MINWMHMAKGEIEPGSFLLWVPRSIKVVFMEMANAGREGRSVVGLGQRDNECEFVC